MKTYQEAAAELADAENTTKAASHHLSAVRQTVAAQLGVAPDGQLGLVPEPIRTSPEYVAAKRAYDTSFFQQRQIAEYINKFHAREHRAAMEAWRDARRAARKEAAAA